MDLRRRNNAEGVVRVTRYINALIVDDEPLLREQYRENLELALEDTGDVKVNFEFADRTEDGKRLLPTGQTKFNLVVVDLIWDKVDGAGREDRGLEVVRQAAKTPGAVIVALTVGDTQGFPLLEHDAGLAGAHIFRIRGAIQAGARFGSWDQLAREILDLMSQNTAETKPTSTRPDVTAKSIFVVCGRDSRRVDSTFDFLRAIGLEPLEWEKLITQSALELGTGGNPNVFATVEYGFRIAHGALVLLTPDDETRLRKDLRDKHDPPFESVLTGQARPNVLLEAGYALSHNPSRLLIVSCGDVRPLSDIGGMHLIHLSNAQASRQKVAERLRAMGFAVDTVGTRWHTVGDFD